MSAATQCNEAGFKALLVEINGKIQEDIPNLKMIEYLEALTYPDAEDLNFMSLIIGRIINEKQLDITGFTTIDVLKNCVDNLDINNCDILLLKLIKQSLDIIVSPAPNSNEERLKFFLNKCYTDYPKLSYHLKMRIQYILYRNIYKIPGSPLKTLRKEFVNFFNNRCLNAQYRNILYKSMNNDDTKIINELKKPGLDPRSEVQLFEFANIYAIEDVGVDMIVPGIVTNITRFGAFVDIGVKQDGLVHVSEIAHKYITDPNEVLKLNQQVQVKVTEVDIARKRIALSIKQTQEVPAFKDKAK